MYSTKSRDTTTTVPANNKDPLLEGGHSTKNGGMSTLKHEISSPKFSEIPIKTELKCNIYMFLNNLYNNIKMCII